MSPEMASKKEYDLQTDMWSLGVLLYFLLSGQEPFNGHGPGLYQVIREGQFSFPSPQWDSVSTAAKDLVSNLLKKDPAKRLTINAAVQHSWVAREKDRWKQYSLPDLSQNQDPYPRKFIAKRWLIGAIQAVIFSNVIRSLRGSQKAGSQSDNVLLHASGASGGASLARITPGKVRKSPNKSGYNPRSECVACGRPVRPEDGVQVGDEYFHYNCFVCGACSQPMRSSYVEGPGGIPYHSECLPSPHRPSKPQMEFCYVCSKPCQSGITALGRIYHERCFTCNICQLQITDEGNYEEENYEPHHRSCLQKQRVQEPWKYTGNQVTPTFEGTRRAPTSSLKPARLPGLETTRTSSSYGHQPAPGSRRLSVDVLAAQSGLVSPLGSHRSNQPSPHGAPSSSGSITGDVRHVRFDNSLSPAPLSPTAQMNPPIRQPQLPAPSGQTFTSKFCHECGAKHLSTSARFCMGCGAARLA
mmetsp:Transcript_96668/g.162747  ORF Transcript_96668/g.162747 Transcript_96668/m.162747 type:complete len:470 (-) Transcript_96668:47-1456(-)